MANQKIRLPARDSTISTELRGGLAGQGLPRTKECADTIIQVGVAQAAAASGQLYRGCFTKAGLKRQLHNGSFEEASLQRQL